MTETDVKQRFIQLRAQNWSFDKIAQELGKAKQTLIDWSKELQDEIANLKAVELEVLYEKYYLLKEARLQTFGEMLTKIKTEVEQRELTDVPTDKLLELLLKYNTLVRDEIVEPNYKTSFEIEGERMDRERMERLINNTRQNRLKVG
jgi:hypothetical protein